MRNFLTPQMMDYDQIKDRWMPYLMFFHRPNFNSKSVNTDSRGCRVSVGAKGEIISSETVQNLGKLSLVVGGSFCFGVGSSSDESTLPSYLSRLSDTTWFNGGGRAFGSVQELLFFTLHMPEVSIDRALIVSGLNDLCLFPPNRETFGHIGAPFGWSQMLPALENASLSKKRRLLKLVLGAFCDSTIDFSRDSISEILRFVVKGRKNIECSVKNLLPTAAESGPVVSLLKRNLNTWKALSNAKNFRLMYALQPVANWIDRQLATEEQKLFAYLSSIPGNPWAIIENYVGSKAIYRWYSDEIRGICSELDIDYIDLNAELAADEYNGKWLYVDRVHMTDLGYEAVSKILIRKGVCR